MTAALDRPTLVLNKHWTPVHVTSVRHAIALVYTGRADIVCPVSYSPHSFEAWRLRGALTSNEIITGIGFEIESPEIVVLGDYNKLPPRGIAFNRRNLIRRDDNTCQYCGLRLANDRLTIDHILPVSRGGATDWDNCVLACHRCNGRKADRTPREAKMKLLTDPSKPEWSPRYAVYSRQGRPKSWDNFIPAAQRELVGAAD